MTLQSILNINSKYHQNMLKYSQPFNEFFKAYYIRVYDIKYNDRVLILDNNLDHLRTYIDKKIYVCDPHLISSNLVKKNHFITWPSKIDKNNHVPWLTNLRQITNISDGITIIKRKDFGYQSFCLCSNKVHEKNHGLYYNNNKYINHYIEILKKNIEHILRDNQEFYMDLKELKNDINNIQESILKNVASYNEIEKFLNML